MERVILGRMEQRRWCAERWLAGWSYAEKTDRNARKSAALVPWEELPEVERDKDRRQVDSIPRVLFGAERGIYR